MRRPFSSCPVEASKIYKDVVSLLAANLRMTSRDDSGGGIDCSFHSGVASEASHFFVEFDSFEALRSRSRQLYKRRFGGLALWWSRVEAGGGADGDLVDASVCLAEDLESTTTRRGGCGVRRRVASSVTSCPMPVTTSTGPLGPN